MSTRTALDTTRKAAPSPGEAISTDIQVVIHCHEPLAHSEPAPEGETKNSVRFPSQPVVHGSQIVDVPYLHENAIRGKIRSLLGEHFLETLDPTGALTSALHPYALATLLRGGTLIKDQEIAADGYAGKRRLRATIPHLSLLGCSTSLSPMAGKLHVRHFWPLGIETIPYCGPRARALAESHMQRCGITLDIAANSVTRQVIVASTRLSHKGVDSFATDVQAPPAGNGKNPHRIMPFEFEYVPAGTVFAGRLHGMGLTRLELGALTLGLELLAHPSHSFLGGHIASGFGCVELALDPDALSDEAFQGPKNEYIAYLQSKREEIINYLLGEFTDVCKGKEKEEKDGRKRRARRAHGRGSRRGR